MVYLASLLPDQLVALLAFNCIMGAKPGHANWQGYRPGLRNAYCICIFQIGFVCRCFYYTALK